MTNWIERLGQSSGTMMTIFGYPFFCFLANQSIRCVVKSTQYVFKLFSLRDGSFWCIIVAASYCWKYCDDTCNLYVSGMNVNATHVLLMKFCHLIIASSAEVLKWFCLILIWRRKKSCNAWTPHYAVLTLMGVRSCNVLQLSGSAHRELTRSFGALHSTASLLFCGKSPSSCNTGFLR